MRQYLPIDFTLADTYLPILWYLKSVLEGEEDTQTRLWTSSRPIHHNISTVFTSTEPSYRFSFPLCPPVSLRWVGGETK